MWLSQNIWTLKQASHECWHWTWSLFIEQPQWCGWSLEKVRTGCYFGTWTSWTFLTKHSDFHRKARVHTKLTKFRNNRYSYFLDPRKNNVRSDLKNPNYFNSNSWRFVFESRLIEKESKKTGEKEEWELVYRVFSKENIFEA